MREPVRLLSAVVACAVGAGPLAAQARVDEGDAFFVAAAEAAARYSDRREAMADGFRRIGPDFPGMGVHWVQTSRIVSPELRGDRPAVLCYVELDGVQTLVGLAYAIPLAPDEKPPVEPFGVEAWHDHSGDVSEESLLLNHPSSVMASDPTFRLSMVHVWMPLDNPDGLIVQNNWRIPFLRAGLEPPQQPAPGPARGLSLGSAGSAYYRDLLHWGAELDAEEAALVDAALDRRAAHVDRWVERHADGWEAAELADLEHEWHELWEELEGLLPREKFALIEPLAAGH